MNLGIISFASKKLLRFNISLFKQFLVFTIQHKIVYFEFIIERLGSKKWLRKKAITKNGHSNLQCHDNSQNLSKQIRLCVFAVVFTFKRCHWRCQSGPISPRASQVPIAPREKQKMMRNNQNARTVPAKTKREELIWSHQIRYLKRRKYYS